MGTLECWCISANSVRRDTHQFPVLPFCWRCIAGVLTLLQISPSLSKFLSCKVTSVDKWIEDGVEITVSHSKERSCALNMSQKLPLFLSSLHLHLFFLVQFLLHLQVPLLILAPTPDSAPISDAAPTPDPTPDVHF